MDRFIAKRRKTARKVPPLTGSSEYLEKYQVWLETFCQELGVCSKRNGYIYLHLFRKHTLARTYQMCTDIAGKAKDAAGSAAAVEQALSAKFSTKAWLPAGTTAPQLTELMPVQGSFLSKLTSSVRPQTLSDKDKTDVVFLSMWFCLAKDLVDVASGRVPGWPSSKKW